MKKRNIALCVILSIVTCGIYGLIWYISLNNEMNQITPNDGYQTSGGMALLWTLLTCGIYGFYWNYRMGQKMDSMKSGNHAILFLLLSIFGLGIVNYCIMQSTLNEYTDKM